MTYAKIENGAVAQYPVYPGDIRLAFPHISFPAGAFDPPEGYVLVADAGQPQPALDQDVIEGEPVELNGTWSRNWQIVTVAPEVAAERLAARRAQVRAAINAKHHIVENGTAHTPLGAVNCDLESRNKINGAVLMALLANAAGQPFSIAWTMADDTEMLHDADDMIAMGQAVGVYVATCHAVARAKKDMAATATTPAELEAIDLDAGWPA